jgi:ribosomal protein S18 acetylase RimI-like enzyme
MSAAIVRKCLPGDFEAIFLLLHQLWPGKEFHKQALRNLFVQGLSSTHEEYYCAEIDRRVVGFCSIWFKNSLWQEGYLGYIGELVVDQPLRRQGIGNDLLAAVFARAKHKGCKRVELDSAASRLDASEFYLKLGFEKRANLFSKVL